MMRVVAAAEKVAKYRHPSWPQSSCRVNVNAKVDASTVEELMEKIKVGVPEAQPVPRPGGGV